MSTYPVDGYFVFLAGDIVGPWLGYWLMFAATITNGDYIA